MVRKTICLTVLIITVACAYSQPILPVAGQSTPAGKTRWGLDSLTNPFAFPAGGAGDFRAVPPQIVIEKQFLYDQHTLADVYPSGDTTRSFQWDKIRRELYYIEYINSEEGPWAILQNYKNGNGEAALIGNFVRNSYGRVADEYGVERYQSVPMYSPGDTVTPVRYGRDGSLTRYIGEEGGFIRAENVNFRGEWLIPKRYVKPIDTKVFPKVIFIDRLNQNICTLEKTGGKWLIRSMNPATTGLHRPPYQQETPKGIFVIQENKTRMVYLKDGSTETGGFAPYASRFTNGAYIHGVPVNVPGTGLIEYSRTLGTTPRSHMCVRNATSHARFIFDWAPPLESLVVVFE